ncbi:hypothetical protein PENNAL_c0090G08951 [Penicillium nalgiovense]|uniref:GED domain-containing protein n=1 Tax=Penicillium nalgiovense TaxID=60175 RepID=A0A1V6XDR3_PENNA|nr:hypothetical protein PENNAL_c0090G08951 [Penicillium nalgiovense]
MRCLPQFLTPFECISDLGKFASTWVTVPCAPFAADVLRLELVGNTGLHLIIVVLPGLISVAECEEDVKVVEDLVDSYLQHFRTIILAVIPATQGIIQHIIDAGTEVRITRLANNCDRIKLALGLFVLKSPSQTELKAGMTTASKSLIEDSVQRDCVKLLSSLEKRAIVDMKEQACSEPKTDLTAYYKVARKTFVDNARRQVIERHIFAKLADAFSPMIVSFYTEEELINLAVESTQIGHLRSEARRLQVALEESLRDLAR